MINGLSNNLILGALLYIIGGGNKSLLINDLDNYHVDSIRSLRGFFVRL